ncbi:MAG: hypothetical protein M1827_006501 [Pycnora praestabilis]|nr:MAG: hypothetical protein M1827_006501 [Pycnora praestabilis]
MSTTFSNKSSPTIRSFNSSNLLPVIGTSLLTQPSTPGSTNAPYKFESPKTVWIKRTSGGSGSGGSGSPPASHETHQERPAKSNPPSRPSSTEDPAFFDLKPPPLNPKGATVDGLAERLFSEDHLRIILSDQNQFQKFTTYLNRYRPHTVPVLIRYLETQKAIKAVEYANAIAETLHPLPGEYANISCAAALIDGRFEARSRKAFTELVTDALPGYLTLSLIKVVTESLIKQITGTETPVMRQLVGGLSEVFCLSDPSIPDNPIVYASEEFYNTTQYGRDYVIGRNCRFLQGPKSDKNCNARLAHATSNGQEICETILNYRRDGSPFLNLLMCAPLYDNKGAVRYYIGAQIDISGLIEDGRGLETFASLLAQDRRMGIGGSDTQSENGSRKPMKTLQELSQMFSHEESDVVRNNSRIVESTKGTPESSSRKPRSTRRVLGNDVSDEEKYPWSAPSLSNAGRLPGVYQNYLLVRPSPSLRITFVSPALRIPGLLQSSFLAHVGGPDNVRSGIAEAMHEGSSVTAKITWLSCGGGSSRNRHEHFADEEGRPRWISCTPLFGSDDRVGVWMVVMVENERMTGQINAREASRVRDGQPRGAEAHNSAKLYSDFLRSQGGTEYQSRTPKAPLSPSLQSPMSPTLQGRPSTASAASQARNRGRALSSQRGGSAGVVGGSTAGWATRQSDEEAGTVVSAGAGVAGQEEAFRVNNTGPTLLGDDID